MEDIVASAETSVGGGSKTFGRLNSAAADDRRMAKLSRTDTDAAASLIDAIKYNRESIPNELKCWFQHCERATSPRPAIFDLLRNLARVCTTEYNLEAFDYQTVLDAHLSLADNNSEHNGSNCFKDNLVCFCENLVLSHFFDNKLLLTFVMIMIAVSHCPDTNYGASLVGLLFAKSLIPAARELYSECKPIERQRLQKRQADGSCVEPVSRCVIENRRKNLQLELIMANLLGGFIRGCKPYIRISWIRSLHRWIELYPIVFLRKSYMEKISLVLNEKVSSESVEVVKTCVNALDSLCVADEYMFCRKHLASGFVDQLTVLASGNSDINLALSAVQLVKKLLGFKLLDNEDLGRFYDLRESEHPEIRQAMEEFDPSPLVDHNSPPGLKALRRTLLILADIPPGNIFSTGYLIVSNWEHLKAIGDWKFTLSMLLDDLHGLPLPELTEYDTTNLIHILLFSVRKAVGADNGFSFLHQPKTSASEYDRNRQDITSAMMETYPRLLRKFMNDKAKISSLVEIILHVDLHLYSISRQGQDLKDTLQLIREVFFLHDDESTLKSCVKVINYFQKDNNESLRDFIDTKLMDIGDELSTRLMNSAEDGDKSLLANKTRLSELTRCVPIECIFASPALIIVQKILEHDQGTIGVRTKT